MAYHELYSQRQKRLKGEVIDVYTYDIIPKGFRIQVAGIIRDVVGTEKYGGGTNAIEFYTYLHNALAREYRTTRLILSEKSYPLGLFTFFQDAANDEQALDFIEFVFREIQIQMGQRQSFWLEKMFVQSSAAGAIEELNTRFKLEGLGYQFLNNELIRIDSTYMHEQVVKNVLTLTSNHNFSGANEEYLSAHQHYRLGNNKECLNDCAKSFESVLKSICSMKGWNYDSTATAAQLIKICFDNQLVPGYVENQFSGLRNLLISGIPVIRNKVGAHGQGPVPLSADDNLTRYALNLTGSNIIYLIEQSGIT